MTESERQKASSEYYSELKKQLDELLKKDTELLKISEKIRNNKANFEDTAKYSEIVSNYIAKVIQDNVGNISSPMGKEYVCKELLNSYYSSINDVLGKVQVSVDRKNNIHIRPQQAPVPTERIEQIAHSLEDTTVSEDVIKRRSGSPVANVAKSFHDDFIKKNATFRNKAGLKCYITRHSSGNCCKWCSSIAGKYLYKDAPHDVFRRHDNCNCTVTYENGKQRQNIWSKEKWQVKDISKEKYKPVKLNYEQAKAIQQNNLNYSNSLVKDKQDKIREFIKQTSQDRDYFREQNYPKENQRNSLTVSDSNGIMNEKKSFRIPITDESIENVQLIQPEGFTIEDAILLKKAHQELLKEARKYPLGTECGMLLDLDMEQFDDIGIIVGKTDGLSLPRYSEPYIALHNHSSGETFSVADVIGLAELDNMYSLTAVGNNGKVYLISKTILFNKEEFYKYIEQYINDTELFKGKKYKEVNKEFINSLTDEEKEDFKKALINFSEKLIEGGVVNGQITYTY